MNAYGDVDEYTSEGVVEFALFGQTSRLRPFTTRPGRLYFVFRDASSGQETYQTARFLYSDLADDDTTVLDSTRHTIRRAPSIHIRPARSRCARTGCP